MTVINVKVVNNIAYLFIKYTNIVICCYCMSVRGKKAGCPIRHIALQLLKCCCQMKSFGITTVNKLLQLLWFSQIQQNVHLTNLELHKFVD